MIGCSGTNPTPKTGACAGLATIRFSEHLCDRVASGEKRITLRARHRRQIAAGQRVRLRCMESGRSFLARVLSVRHTSWRGITDAELKDDGFSDRGRLLPIMRRYYPGIGLDDPATVYRWRDARTCR